MRAAAMPSCRYYRADVLRAAQLPVPATWEDLLLVAQTINGSDFNNGKP